MQVLQIQVSKMPYIAINMMLSGKNSLSGTKALIAAGIRREPWTIGCRDDDEDLSTFFTHAFQKRN